MKEEIIEKLKELIVLPVEEVKDSVEELKQSFYKIRKQEVEEARKLFVEEGGTEETFVVEPDETEETFKTLLNSFKEKKAALLADQQKIRETNLKEKLQIIEDIKTLCEKADEVGKRYPDFQQLQQRFKEITLIPPTHVNDIWKNYQLQVENFYELLKINKELRDYDFKKNFEHKFALCEAAERLAEEKDVISAFHQLQKLHDEWREIGPVSKEHREELWNRFKDASTVVNKAHQQHFDALREKEQNNEQEKIALCEAAEAVTLDDLTSFNKWEDKTKVLLELQEKWKTIGFAPKKVNNELFDRFRKGCNRFFDAKSEYFKSVKDEMNTNLDRKKALCEKAEALKDSTDWKKASESLVELQKEWKTIGAVSKKHSDIIWKRFIAACDFFFEQKNKHFSANKESEQANLAQKKELISKLEAIDEATEGGEAVKLVRSLMDEFNALGHVPFKEKDKIYTAFHEVVDKQFARLNIQESKNRIQSFKSSISNIAEKENSQSQLYRERDRMVRTYETMKQELKTYENNIGFFTSSSKSGGGMLKEMNKKIQKLKDDMEVIAQKVTIIDESMK
jgi:cell division FtsZ-interacting protein ZapD